MTHNLSDGCQRSPIVEREFLDRAQRLARHTVASFPTHVQARLALGQQLYGDSWSERPVGDLLAEAAEEAIDLAAWSCLAIQALEEADLAVDAKATIGELLARASGRAAEAYGCLVGAEAVLRKERSGK